MCFGRLTRTRTGRQPLDEQQRRIDQQSAESDCRLESHANKTWSGLDNRLQRYRHFKFFQHGGGRHLGFVRTVNSAARSAVPENPTLEPNMKWIGSPVAEIWPVAYVGGIWNPVSGGRRGRRGSTMGPLERATVVSYRLSIVTVALSVTIRPHFAIECLRRSNQQGGGSLWAKI